MMQHIFQTFTQYWSTIPMIYWNCNKSIRFNIYTSWRIISYSTDMDVVIGYMWDKDVFSHFAKSSASITPHEESVRPRQAENRSDPERPFTKRARFIRISNEPGFESCYGFLFGKVHLFVVVPETKNIASIDRKIGCPIIKTDSLKYIHKEYNTAWHKCILKKIQEIRTFSRRLECSKLPFTMAVIEKSCYVVHVNIKKHLSKNMNIRTIDQYTWKYT